MALSCERRGEGLPLVLVHGVGANWETWAPVIDLLALRREVFAVDLPGFGISPPLPAHRPPSVRALAAAVAEWMAEEGLERPSVASNSLGGAIALELAGESLVRSATALSPIGFWNRLEHAYGAGALRMTYGLARVTGPIAPIVFGNPVGRTLALAHINGRPWRVPADAAVRASRVMAAAPAFKDVLRATRGYQFAASPPADLPLTVAWGKRDRLLSSRQAKRAKRLLPGARFLELPGCGHVPMADDPGVVSAVLLEGSEVPAPAEPVR